MLAPIWFAAKTQVFDPLETPVYAPDGGYSLSHEDYCSSTEMESGVIVKRKRTTATYIKTSVVWNLSTDGYGKFRRWFSSELNSGQHWFGLRIPTGRAGENCSSVNKVQFSASPPWNAERIGSNWQVTAELRILDKL